MSSVLDISGAAAEGGLPALRPLDLILSFETDDPRFPKMQESWLAFGPEMGGQVRAVLDGGGSSAEIGYGVGVLVHNYFRSRGVTLTSYELRALAAELVDRVEPSVVAAEVPPAAPTKEITTPTDKLISFAGEEKSADAAWVGEEALAPPPTIAEAALSPPPSHSSGAFITPLPQSNENK